MPPKKSKKKTSMSDGGELDVAQVARAYQLRNSALRMKLAEKSQSTGLAVKAKRELQQRVAEVEQDATKTEAQLLAVTADMTRQHKAMEEKFLNKINSLENEITSLKDELADARIAYEDMCAEKDQTIAEKDMELEKMKAKMEQMADEFGHMLEETLRRMSEKIEVSAAKWESEASVPAMRREGRGGS